MHQYILICTRRTRAALSAWLCFVLVLSGCAYLGQSSADLEAAQRQARSAQVPAEIWPALRAGFSLPLLDSKLVTNQVRAYTKSPSHLTESLTLATPYLYFILEEVQKRNMPTELALLPFVESGFNITEHYKANKKRNDHASDRS